VILAHGGSLLALARSMASQYEIQEIESGFAQRGDVVYHLVGRAKAESLGVCIGNMAASPGKRGLTVFPMASVIAAWRI
jgi:hypothetical protein